MCITIPKRKLHPKRSNIVKLIVYLLRDGDDMAMKYASVLWHLLVHWYDEIKIAACETCIFSGFIPPKWAKEPALGIEPSSTSTKKTCLQMRFPQKNFFWRSISPSENQHDHGKSTIWICIFYSVTWGFSNVMLGFRVVYFDGFWLRCWIPCPFSPT